MMIGARSLVVLLAVAAVGVVPCEALTLVKGVAGGTVRGTITDGNHRTVECSIAIPDSFVVLEVAFAPDRVLVAACVQRGWVGQEEALLSEFWMFSAPDTLGTTVTFADRRVLLSHRSSFGESYTLYAGSVSCADATAVCVHGWEWAGTRLFDARGAEIRLDDNLVKKICRCRPDYVRPVAWVEGGRRPELVCDVQEEGGRGPCHFVFDLATGTVDTLTAAALTGDLGRRLLSACARP